LDRNADAFVAPLYGNNIVKPWLYAASFGAKALHPHLAQLDLIPGYCDFAHEKGVRVHPWTVDSEADIARMFGYGVDAVITNRPDVARSVLEK
ncbi:MAG: glycerophosphodiester phosphodiesterase family protein, partial [Eubacteriales bacterium]